MKKYNLPVDYRKLNRLERSEVRHQYYIEQKGMCYYCKASLKLDAPAHIKSKQIYLPFFPPNFFDYPVHLHHDHDTGMTIGAVHNYCNAVLWQYEGK